MEEKKKLPLITTSFLVLGNCLGVGVLALPIKSGLAGYIPSFIGIGVVWLIMLFAAWIIAYRLSPTKKNFDIPSFFQQELGITGRWIAIICNLILLYGILVAYLSGISTMLSAIFARAANHQTLIIFIYFFIVTGLIIYGANVLRRGNTVLIAILWLCFAVMILTGNSVFKPKLLLYQDWWLLPTTLPIAVSAFHFHNIIPTVSRMLEYDAAATRKALFLGVFLGLIINMTWVTLVLGSLPAIGPGPASIVYANAQNLTANIPMGQLLQSSEFDMAGIIFAVISVTCSFVANGTGLYGFMRDLTTNYLKTDNRWVVGALSYLPPLAVTLIYPKLFLKAISIVGGIGETILFGILPAVILIRLAKGRSPLLVWIGYAMLIISTFIFLYVAIVELGFVDMKLFHSK